MASKRYTVTLRFPSGAADIPDRTVIRRIDADGFDDMVRILRLEPDEVPFIQSIVVKEGA